MVLVQVNNLFNPFIGSGYNSIFISSTLQIQSGQSLTPDSPPEDLAGGSEVVRSTGGVGVHPLAQESKVLHCGKP